MAKKFELSTYGVEKMSKKELLEVTGGIIPVWKVVEVVLGRINTFLAVRAVYNEATNEVTQDRKLREPVKIQADYADSIHVNGMTLYGLDDVTIIM